MKAIKSILSPIMSMLGGGAKAPAAPTPGKTPVAPVSDSKARQAAAERTALGRGRGGRGATMLRDDTNRLG